jgi:preprotein translocase subunit SecG
MFTVFGIILILVSIFLVGVILLQPGKGDISASFGGLSSQFGSMFGMQRTTNIFTKMTMILAGALLLLTLLINRFMLAPAETQVIKPVTEGAAVPAQTSPIQQPTTPLGGGK